MHSADSSVDARGPGESPAKRSRRRRGLRRLWIAGLILLAWLLAGLRQLDPSSEFGVVDSPLIPDGSFLVQRSLVVVPPGLFRLTRYPRIGVEIPLPPADEAQLQGEDGSRYGFRGWVTLQVRLEEWRQAHLASQGDGLRGVLLDAVRAAGSELPPGAETGLATAAVSRALNTRLSEELDRRGVALRGFELITVDFLMARPGEPLQATDTKLLVVGLDGADWEILDSLMEQERMPNLERLIQNGVRAKLLSINPTLSPVVWTSVATGVEPGRHGILDFLVDDPEGGPGQPVTSAQRQAATVWEILSRAGVTVGVVGWWASWPAEPVRGYLVSDRVAYQLFGYRADPEDSQGKTWPPEIYQEVRQQVVIAESVPWKQVRPYLDGSRVAPEQFPPEEQKMLEDFRTLLASGQTYLNIAMALRERMDPRLEVVYFEGTDTVGHLFMPYRPPRLRGVDSRRYEDFKQVVNRYYETADGYLGRLLQGRDESWTVMILSDHGFVSDATRPRLTDSRIGHGAAADWHQRFGVLVLSGAHVQSGKRLGEASVYDIAPTILALFGQPVPRSWPGHALGQALDPEFLEQHPVRYRAQDPARGELVAGTGGQPVDPAALELVEKLKSLGYVSSSSRSQSSMTARNNAGVALMAEGRYAEAESSFRAALREQPGSPNLVVNLGAALRLQGRSEEARELFVQAFQYSGTRRVAGHLLAQLSLEASDLREAERYLREVLRAEPGAPDVRTTLGVVLEMKGQLEDAEAEYHKATALDPDAAKPRNQLGTLARRRGDSERAEQWYLKAIEADPYFMGSYNNLALVYQDRGQMNKAIDLYSRALTKAPSNAVVLNNLASLYYAQGDHEEAAKLWRRAVAADPSYPSPLNNLAGLEIHRENYRTAERLLRRALELESGYGDARLNLALIHWARGERDAARSELQQAAVDVRSRPRALSQLGFLEFELGRYAEAASALDQARTAGARDPKVFNVLGESYRLVDRKAEAAEAWRASLALDPEQAQLRQRLSELESIR